MLTLLSFFCCRCCCRFVVEKTKSHFTGDYFTFFKEPIGMEAHQEILRYAKQRKVVFIHIINTNLSIFQLNHFV